ncbi:CAMK family protein kinase [Tritrichomonas foetus]|uniref:CAMK family protein kinase n=1 Tax=Tritrichomonas foetus TaxID=1144522 RepID=A0A1J4JSB2_9EUKA|nr:CAMK family protein kinase [Tritrichomonas foetus]|eukprot:OHT00420.1 CAMK family protein kinase [Tritrichomonas foetus]
METIVTHPILGDFSIKMELGKGAFASVYLAVHKVHYYPIALKIFDILDDEDEMEDVDVETAIFESFDNPLICSIYDVFEFQGHKCLILEFVEGESLLDYANENGPFTSAQVRFLFLQIATAVCSLHKQHIVHRDIKCENIIVNYNGNIKLIDFGFSVPLNPGDPLLTDTCGSPAYVAPEVVVGIPYGYEVDIWSLGVILYAISFGRLPFDHQNVVDIITMVATVEPEIPMDASPLLADLIQKLLNKDPAQRITFEDIFKHPWITRDEFGRLYEYDASILDKYTMSPNGELKIHPEIFDHVKTSKTIEDVKNDLIEKRRTREALEYKILFRNEMMKYLCRVCFHLLKLAPKKKSLNEQQNENSNLIAPKINEILDPVQTGNLIAQSLSQPTNVVFED